jgi:hypothetical protein
MPLQHYLPATYLANFSNSVRNPRRDSLIAVGDKRTGRCFTTAVSQVAAIKDFYALFAGAPELLGAAYDDSFAAYEGGLDAAISGLANNTLPAATWANVLVPFVADLMVRPPDFNERFGRRIESLELGEDLTTRAISRTNLGGARWFERHWLLAQVAVADWKVLEVVGERLLIINDVGYAPTYSKFQREIGIAIPLNTQFILIVNPKLRRRVVVEHRGEWRPTIQRSRLYPNDHLEHNRVMAKYAQRFVFAEDEQTVRTYLFIEENPPRTPEPTDLGFQGGTLARAHEMDYFRLITALATPPKARGAWVSMDLSQSGRRSPLGLIRGL